MRLLSTVRRVFWLKHPCSRLSSASSSPIFTKSFTMASNQHGDGKKPSAPLYQLVDIGANLTSGKYGRELDEVIQRAVDAGIFKIMVTGSSIESSKDGK